MNARSQMWTPPTFEVLPNAISLPDSECGVTPSDSPTGPMIDLFGREVVPVRVSAPQEKAKGLQTLVTSGHIGYASSGSADLQRCLENRLVQRLDTAGSTLFTLTWKRRRTPLGRPYLERAASVRRTSGSGCTSVPTPNTPSGGPNSKSTATHTGGMDLDGVATLSAVPTPCTPNGGRSMDPDKMDATGRTLDGRKHTASLEHAVKLSDYSRKIVELASVPTPMEYDGAGGGSITAANRKADGLKRPSGASYGSQLRHEVMLYSVASPSARDWKDTSGMSETGVDPDGSILQRLDQLPRQAQLADSGLTATGGTPATKSIGQLNPEYSRWLMGLPIEFSNCVDLAMRSVRNLRKRS
jgi:hypothetical protein